MNKRAAVILAAAALWSGQSVGQTPAAISDTGLSKDVENPVTRQITLPLRYEADFDDGAYQATKDTFEIDQAVLPFRLNEDWALITRTKLPLASLPPKKLGEHWTFGLSNGYTTFFLSPEHGQGFYWGRRAGALLPNGDKSGARRQQMGLGSISRAFAPGRESVGIRRCRQRYLVGRLIAGNHHELDRERREMDRPNWRRFRQAVPSGRTGREGRSGQLLQRRATPGQQRNVACAAQVHLCVPEVVKD
jgi:hypothetical protein